MPPRWFSRCCTSSTNADATTLPLRRARASRSDSEITLLISWGEGQARAGIDERYWLRFTGASEEESIESPSTRDVVGGVRSSRSSLVTSSSSPSRVYPIPVLSLSLSLSHMGIHPYRLIEMSQSGCSGHMLQCGASTPIQTFSHPTTIVNKTVSLCSHSVH